MNFILVVLLRRINSSSGTLKFLTRRVDKRLLYRNNVYKDLRDILIGYVTTNS